MQEEIELTEDDDAILDRVWGIVEERENQDNGPTLLLQPPRNLRAPLHAGLEVVDDTVSELQKATPDAMGDITGQVLRVLSDARDYPDARQRLAVAFPDLDRSALRNMLTGAMLVNQAAGMVTVQREVEGE